MAMYMYCDVQCNITTSLTHGSVVLWQLHPRGSCGGASFQCIDVAMQSLVIYTLHRANQTPLRGGVTTLSTEHLHMGATLPWAPAQAIIIILL